MVESSPEMVSSQELRIWENANRRAQEMKFKPGDSMNVKTRWTL